MRKLTYAVAVIGAVFAVSASSTPGRADMWNGPIQRDGKCWKSSFPQGIGYWGECAKPAAASVPRNQPIHRHHS
jgi:hypothetical protein